MPKESSSLENEENKKLHKSLIYGALISTRSGYKTHIFTGNQKKIKVDIYSDYLQLTSPTNFI